MFPVHSNPPVVNYPPVEKEVRRSSCGRIQALIVSVACFSLGLAGAAVRWALQSEKERVWLEGADDRAAIKIQKMVRGFLTRKAFLNVPYGIYRDACRAVDRDTPKAMNGLTDVYLPRGMDIVIKESGRQVAIKRFHQMQDVRRLLTRSKDLVIPAARLFEGNLIEERLPVNCDRYQNMHLYCTKPELFDGAVRDMADLFSKVFIDDLVSRQIHPLSDIVGDCVRYDNMPLYIVEEKGVKRGKIGLIDLEFVYKNPLGSGFLRLARIFPYHGDLLLAEAKKLGVYIDESEFDKHLARGELYLEKAYHEAVRWIRSKPLQPKREIIKVDRWTEKKICQGIAEMSENALDKDLTQRLYDTSISELNARLYAHLKKHALKLSEGEEIAVRSPVFYRDKIFKKRFNKETKKESYLFYNALEFILDELVKSKKLLEFKKFRKRGQWRYWIRF